MTILTTENVSTQNLYFIPRSASFTDIYITDEQTNVTTEITGYYQVSNFDYYFQLKTVFNLKENHFYMIEFKNNDAIIYRDKIFCTDQPIVSFSVNNAQYTSNTTTNEFIVYE